MQAKGSKAQLRGYEESVYGTYPASGNAVRLPVIDISLNKTQDLVESRVLSGDRNATLPVPGEVSVGGGFTMQPDIRSIGWILKHFFGDYSVTGAGPYTHVFKVGSLPTGLSLEKFFSDLGFALMYTGCKINRFALDVTPAGILEASCDVIGQQETYLASPVDASPLLHPIVPFKQASATLSEGGSSMTRATGFSIDMTNNVEGTRVITNNGLIAEAPEGLFRATGRLSVLFESMTLYQKALNQTESALILTFPGATGGHSMQLIFDEILYGVASPGVPGPGGIVLDLNWQAYYENDSDASAARVVLINDVATYAAIP